MKHARSAVTVAVILILGLTGCSKPDAPSKPAATLPTTAKPAQPYEAVAAQAKGFTVGALMSAHPVYVLFDPQCPHCGHLWEAALPLHNRVKFVWIPVSIMNGRSGPQGAALLTASDPAAAMSVHEKSILAGTGGMSAPASVPRDVELAIQKNTALLGNLGAESVPYIVARNVSTGLVVSVAGSLTTPDLAKFLGLATP